MTDNELKELIKKNAHRFTETYTRYWYEDEWRETRANQAEIFNFIKEYIISRYKD